MRCCYVALECFIKDFGGKSNFKIQNVHEELKISKESSINLVDRRLKFHGDLVKKVYNENNVEFKDSLSAVNYMHNRAIEDIAPEIAKEIRNFYITFGDPLVRLKQEINCYADILRLRDSISSLDDADRINLSAWLSSRFGGVLLDC